ncbi:bifunctional 3-(3-hydroxy-phenyl)propionate/3-hydroxycinnamic acid hydroxylase [Aquabacterium soli]|uniref:Bifunctional 3-(3-hydroxy-phenyl)propionate/3-hydroxycinnamic acid hydroxylase n=1 Tax=Aquabacterium soli TaxID=2493092 RepID=A0A3R8U0Y3_9BURK|nr:bifunctional 3-(3-hydroxy-phenyl)propionate/3-hydroxycinnamic acid hydroxylase [Aquabacterium soli]RRS02348.1 bifunctional 3-(3-hydroxy-phenyl)propionate/3-hydroxycinnamic acid hydroxylase [Aquabacterium soli]
MSDLPSEVDVLIVGMGPVGAALAQLLGRYGTKALVIDKARDIFLAPRAIALDNEALRVLQLCGLEEDAFDKVAIPEVRMRSPLFGQYSRAVTAGCVDGHPKLVTFFQPQLEQALRARLQGNRHVTVALGVSLVSLSQDDQEVLAELQTDDGRPHQVRARYMVGADGANSLVRRLLGQEFKGKTFAEDWLVVDAKHLPTPMDHVEFICDPRRPTPHMVAPGGRQRWEFKLNPGETREQMEHPDMVRRLLQPWIKGEHVEIERVAVYRFHARVVDKFKVGRVLLVGDAAHITPPFVGQGLVSGLRDVANLAWKLSWVCHGRAQPGLLDSYDQERRPHAKAMIDLAKMMGRLVMPSNQVAAFLTHGAMSMMTRIPRFKRLFENLEIKPPNRFKVGCFVKPLRGARLRRGEQMPQVWLKPQAGGEVVLSDDVLGSGLAMVGFGVDPSAGLTPALNQAWTASGGRFVQINPRGPMARTSTQSLWEDLGGNLMPSLVPVGWLAIVRPDKVVMNDGPCTDAASLLAQAMNLYVRRAGERTAIVASAHG